MTDTPFHAGELEAQARAGVERMAARVGRSIHHEFVPAAAHFLEQATLIALATTDPSGRPWASLLGGPPGLATVLDPRAVLLRARPVTGDPAGESLRPGAPVGLLAPDLATRRRLRLNGTIESIGAEGLVIRAAQIYANCPKYIQRRQPLPVAPVSNPIAVAASSLDGRQRDWIRRADTFFLATANPGEGADASHRGGTPGFLSVEGNCLSWPDYAGNMMFNSLGNIVAYPQAGVTIADFATGDVLLLSGGASIDWTPDQRAHPEGAERMLHLAIERVVELPGSLPLRADWVEPSPFNPGQ